MATVSAALAVFVACSPFGGSGASPPTPDDDDSGSATLDAGAELDAAVDASASCAGDDCPIEELFGLTQAYYLRSDESYVYAGSRSNRVVRWDKTTGVVLDVRYGNAIDPRSPAVLDGQIWVPTESGIIRLSDPVSPSKLTANPATEALPYEGDVYSCHFHPTDARDVTRYRNGGALALVSNVLRCESLAISRGYLFFGGHKLHRVPLSASMTVQEDTVDAAPLSTRRLAADNLFVYSVAEAQPSVWRTTIDTLTTANLVNFDEPIHESDLHLDGDHLYVGTGRSNGSLWRIHKGTGATELIAKDLGTVVGITTDATHVYWSEYDTGRVRRRRK